MENASCGTPTIQPQPQTQPPQPQIEGQTLINSTAVGRKRKPPKYVVWLHCNKVKKKDETCVDKVVGVDKYLTDPFVNPLNKHFKLLDWWKGNKSRYPILAKIVKDIFAITYSTVASENAFNLEKRIVDPFRSSLTLKIVETLVCSSDWLRAEEFCFYYEPIEDELAFYIEREQIEANAMGTETTQASISTSQAQHPSHPPLPSPSWS
ncbi:unnamed protein product [Prunus armeniaca]